jgi:hypothetical protein
MKRTTLVTIAAVTAALTIPATIAQTADNGTRYFPAQPCRVADTRTYGRPGITLPTTPANPGGWWDREQNLNHPHPRPTTYRIGTKGCVPEGATAAMVTITAVSATNENRGFITAWDGTGTPPLASVLNIARDRRVVSTTVPVELDRNGKFALFLPVDLQFGYNDSLGNVVPPSGLVVDINGWYAP